jgi:hypothetical protein
MPKDTTVKAVRATKPKGDKPKRGPSAYIIFSTENRAEVKAANPDATFGELGKLLGAKWGSMTEAEKAVSLLYYNSHLLLTVNAHASQVFHKKSQDRKTGEM